MATVIRDLTSAPPYATYDNMDLIFKRRIKSFSSPQDRHPRLFRIRTIGLRMMLASSSKQPSRGGTPPRSPSAIADLSELSDVPCYTCRRRHVKCDRILPHCAKCRKKGVECLGYQKPLRWADGVAVRGKLKGKVQPVVDSRLSCCTEAQIIDSFTDNCMSLERTSVHQQRASTLQEAAHLGVSPSDSCCNDVVVDQSHLTKIIAYYNSTICLERLSLDDTKFTCIDREIAPLTLDYVQKLPKSIVNCLIGIAAVHMASRNPGNSDIERLALETKVNVLQSHNQLLRVPQTQLNQQPDVVISCGLLIYAMDLLEHGMSRWMVHTLGMMHVMSSFGGIETLASHYPHLHMPLLHTSLVETMWIITSYIPLTKPKQVSRNALDLLGHSQFSEGKIFRACSTSLTLAIWDIAACAQKIFGRSGPISLANMHKRERILVDVLSFQPEEDTHALEEHFFPNAPSNDTVNIQLWDYINTIWKSAVTILVLRYLYFGRPELFPASATTPFHTPAPFVPEKHFFRPSTEGLDFTHFPESVEQDYLTAGLLYTNLNDTLSRSPSPMPPPHLPNERPNSNLWDARYDIHDEAFTTLADTLSTLKPHLLPLYLRSVLIPVIILALVSRRDSEERAVCTWYFAKFEEFMAAPSTSPVGGEKLALEIPWEKLDAYSESVEMQGGGGSMKSAPEWNWWDMLKHVDLDMSWVLRAGHSHVERGSEFCAFELISSVANDECFTAWLQEPTPSGSTALA